MATTNKTNVKAKLAKVGVTTIADLDTYRNTHLVTRSYPNGETRTFVPSRYDVLVTLVGENVAMYMMQELAIQQCTGRA